jgi:hypothetical protein
MHGSRRAVAWMWQVAQAGWVGIIAPDKTIASVLGLTFYFSSISTILSAEFTHAILYFFLPEISKTAT